MTTSRQRMLDALEYNDPDRIPVVYHPSPAGLYTHGQKLLDLFNQYPPDNPIAFDSIPQPPQGTVDQAGRYHEITTDDWGTTWEYLIYGIQGHPKEYALQDWKAEGYSFPPVSPIGSEAFAAEKRLIDEQRKEFLVFYGWASIFEVGR